MKRRNLSAKNGFSGRLKQLREGKNLSQAELAELVGIHHMHMSRYERGLARPSADALKRLADALGVTGDYLLDGETSDLAMSRLEDRDLLNLFIEVEKLPPEEKLTVKKVVYALVNQQKIEDMRRPAMIHSP